MTEPTLQQKIDANSQTFALIGTGVISKRETDKAIQEFREKVNARFIQQGDRMLISYPFDDGYNQALRDVLELLGEPKK